MKLATVRADGRTALAGLTDAGVLDLSGALPGAGGLDSVDALCAALAGQGDGQMDALRRLADSTAGFAPRWATEEVQLLAPLRRPGKVICVGLNYRDHCRETGIPEPAQPVLFAKFSSAIVGPEDAVDLHPAATAETDWEVELAAVIGERAGPRRRATPDMLLGYTVANDVSARDLQRDDGQWVRAKSLDTFLPLGPVVVTPDELGDPNRLGLGLAVNGEPQQDSSTAEMIFDLEYLLAWITASISLEPGDLLLTGTPHGTGAFQHPPRFLAQGDVMEAWVERIGTLRNPVCKGN
ncbi:MAG TPA: fumarylacetoacetate hydrolase family protein [Streptosporangiaceae bacterium]|nr:fumarylacetoacetate hydrolase family protein [Streptosporangiaceae bacterium]